MYFDGPTFWPLVYRYVPGASAIRSVSRVGLLTLLPAALGLSLLFERLLERRMRWTTVAIAVFCVVEQGVTTPSYDKQAQRDLVAKIASRVPPECETFFYSPRFSQSTYQQNQLDGMWASLTCLRPTINGYSGNYPPDWIPLSDSNLTKSASERSRARVLDEWIKRRGLNRARVSWIKGLSAAPETPARDSRAERGRETP
jgi:hypothetical protein